MTIHRQLVMAQVARLRLPGFSAAFLIKGATSRRILVPHSEALMPVTGPIPEGETFFCPHCGALYAVLRSRLSDAKIAKCVVCLHIMEERESTKVPIYKLVQRPEDA